MRCLDTCLVLWLSFKLPPILAFYETSLLITCFVQQAELAQLAERRTGMPPTQVRFPVVARTFSPGVNFQCRLSYAVRTPPCAITCINICAHVRDPVVHVRVRGIIERIKTPSMYRRLGSAILSQLAFPVESNPNFLWGNYELFFNAQSTS